MTSTGTHYTWDFSPEQVKAIFGERTHISAAQLDGTIRRFADALGKAGYRGELVVNLVGGEWAGDPVRGIQRSAYTLHLSYDSVPGDPPTRPQLGPPQGEHNDTGPEGEAPLEG